MGEDSASSNRVSVYKAAEILGITVDAIRKRVQRGTIPHERGEDGRVWVVLDTSGKVQDNVHDIYQPQPDTTALISRLEDEVRFLREELARKDAILLRMAESIPQLEAPSEPRESPVTATEAGDRGERAGAEEGVQRPWWRRIFG